MFKPVYDQPFRFLKMASLFLFFFSFSALAPSGQRTRSLLTPLPQKEEDSLYFVRLRDGKVLYGEGEDKKLSPASVSKLITSAAVLDQWGGDKRFETRFYRTGPVKKGVIYGDLVVVGGGDPLLVSEKIWQIANDLKNMGYRGVEGHLRIDQNLFSDQNGHEVRKKYKMTNRSYEAPVTALGVNFNTYSVTVSSAQGLKEKARLALNPYPMEGLKVVNKVKTVGKNKKPVLSLTRHGALPGKTQLIVKGVMPLASSPKKVYVSCQSPSQSAGRYLKSFLRQEGIYLKGQIRQGPLPSGATLIYTHKSPPLSEILESLNIYSNNYIADVLIHSLGAEVSASKGGKISTYQRGLKKVRDFLKYRVKGDPSFIWQSGSGLHTSNRVSAKQVVQVLSYIYKKPLYFPEYLMSLPRAGINGTLEKRFSSKSPTALLQGKVRAKTGTLTRPVSVSSLAGFFHHPKHGMVAFAMLQNGKTGHKQPSILDLQLSQEMAILKLWKKI